MDNNWYKLNQFDDKTYPKINDSYLTVCVKPNGRGLGDFYRTVAYYNSLSGFDVKDAIVLYWKEISYPDDLSIDYKKVVN